ncbi:ABZJ_00895 family protein [Kordiimonas pumila]|uniref:ABZJ_00895 family protein n=1 Tax=Kordiimonas pumila TaxID=2161677 RepID=A0ABV7D0R9_9PROT|nr:ABZJ_00895 family protein [Kordiimonas pumila]
MIGEFTKAHGPEVGFIKRSMIVYIGVYTLATVVFIAAQIIFDFNMKYVDGIVTLYTAGFLSGSFAVKRVQRMLLKEERTQLIIGCLSLSCLLQLLVTYIVLNFHIVGDGKDIISMLGSLPVLLLVAVLSFLFLIYFLIISRAIALGAKAQFANIEKRNSSEKADV